MLLAEAAALAADGLGFDDAVEDMLMSRYDDIAMEDEFDVALLPATEACQCVGL